MRRLHLAVLVATAVPALAAAPASAAWLSTASGGASAQAGYWGSQLRWTGSGTACDGQFTCTVPKVGNGGTVTTSVELTDATGRVVSNLGAVKTVTVSLAPNDSGQFVDPVTNANLGTAPQTLTLPATGAAISTTAVRYKAGTGNWSSDTVTATAGNVADAKLTLTKS